MPVQWAGLAPPLLVDVRRDAGLPLRAQLEGGLRDAIRSGRLPVGERLPSSRELARQLGLSRGLVQECYGQLQAEGYLSARRRVGHARGGRGRGAEPATPTARRRPAARRRGSTSPPACPTSPLPARGLGVGGARGLPHRAVADLDYGDPRGDPRLREVLAGYAGRVARRSPTATGCVVCSGFAQGATLVLRTLARAGYDRIALENPGNGDPAQSASSRAALRIGRALHHVPVDERRRATSTRSPPPARRWSW